MNTNKCVIGIPKNTRLRTDVQPLLENALAIKQSQPGQWESPYLKNTGFVEMKIPDLVRCLRSRYLDLALISDDKGLEERAGIENIVERSANSGSVRMNLRDRSIERCFGLGVENPAVLRTLVREENRETAMQRLFRKTYSPVALYERGVTSYPELMSYYFRRKFGKDISGSDIWRVDGQVESFMRSGVVPNLNYAYDIVGSGETARKFGLVSVDEEAPAGDKSYRALPSFWKSDYLYEYQEEKLETILPEIRKRISEVVELDERNSQEVLKS